MSCPTCGDDVFRKRRSLVERVLYVRVFTCYTCGANVRMMRGSPSSLIARLKSKFVNTKRLHASKRSA